MWPFKLIFDWSLCLFYFRRIIVLVIIKCYWSAWTRSKYGCLLICYFFMRKKTAAVLLSPSDATTVSSVELACPTQSERHVMINLWEKPPDCMPRSGLLWFSDPCTPSASSCFKNILLASKRLRGLAHECCRSCGCQTSDLAHWGQLI